MNNKSILILGVGNYLLRDEGIGIHVINKLKEKRLPDEFELVDGGTCGYELVSFFQSREKVIIIDCFNSNEPPGTIIFAKPDELDLKWKSCYSIHQGGLFELLSQKNFPNPFPEINIVGIVPEVVNELGMNLSPELEEKINDITSSIYELLTTKFVTV